MGQAFVTYKGKPLSNAPTNVMECNWGCRPSFGQFQCSKKYYDEILAEGAGAGNLVINDGESEITLLNIYIVKSTWEPARGSYTLIVADRRVLWQNTFCESDYNTYKSQALNTDDGDEYELDDLNAGNNWTYPEVLDNLFTDGDDDTSLSADPDREPRNLRGVGKSLSDFGQQLMYELNDFMCLDPISNITYIEDLGLINADDTTALSAFEQYISRTHFITQGSLSKPLKIKAFYATVADAGFEWKTATVTDGVIGERGYYTNYTDSNNGQDYAQEFADELADAMGDAILWRTTEYVGTQNITLSTEVHCIRWECGDHYKTITKRLWPQEIPTQVYSNIFSANGFKMGGSGDGTVIPVSVTKVSGSAGDGTTECSFVYDITKLGEMSVFQSNIELIGHRPHRAKMHEGTYGLAAPDENGDWWLWTVDERAYDTDCEEVEA